MAHRRKDSKKETKNDKVQNNDQSFLVEDEKMPSFMHSLFDSEEKSGPKMEESNKQNLRISKIQVEKAREKLQKRNKPMSKALQEIKHLQNSTKLVCRRAGFQRFVKKIAGEVAEGLYIKETFRYSSQSLEALQSLTEQYMIDLFEDSAQCSIHARRITLMAKDINLTARIRGIPQPTLQDIRNLKYG